MDNNSFLLPKSKMIFQNIKSKTTVKKNLGSLPNNLYPYLYIDKKYRNKSIIEPKIFKTEFNSRKNSLLNSKNNSNSKRHRLRSVNYITSASMEINNNQKNNIVNNISNNDNDNFDIDKIEIKDKEDFQLPNKLTKLFDKPKNQNVTSYKKKDQYLRTETNQKVIFNNVGIHYHRTKNNNRGDTEKAKIFHDKEINSLKAQIKILLKKNEVLTTEKTERDNKIEALEEKIDKLLNFIKEKKLSGADENNKLKNKINNLENKMNYLKSENEELKKEIEKKDKIILSLTNNQTESPSHKKNVSIGKKKEKGDKNKKNNVKKQNSNNNNAYYIDEDDIKKIKLISIDPDTF